MPKSCSSRSGALLLALLLQTCMEVRGWCLASGQCQDLTTESNLLACIRACRPDLAAETPRTPGLGDEQPPSEPARKYVMGHFRWDRWGRRPGSGEGGERKRSYSMEHFRWGKPVGKKRRPVKVYPNGAEDEAADALPADARRQLAERPDAGPRGGGSPRPDKRYGGFLSADKSRTPLVTLFKNAIGQSAPPRGP